MAVGWRRVGAAGAALTAAVGVMLSGRATAAPGVLGPEQVVVLRQDPGVRLVPPVDGRIRGQGFSATVTGVATAGRAGVGSEAARAGRGRVLVVFGVQLVTFPDEVPADTPAPKGVVDAGGERSALPDAVAAGSGTVNVMVSAPVGRDVAVEYSAGGLTQRFSVSQGRRESPAPLVLYRDAVAPVTVDTVEQVGSLPLDVVVSPTEAAHVAIQVQVRSAALDWFNPTPGGPPPSGTDKAWLVVDAQSKVDNSNGPPFVAGFGTNLPGDRVQLMLADGTAIAARHEPPAGSQVGDAQLLAGVYYFEVPADIRRPGWWSRPASCRWPTASTRARTVTVNVAGQMGFDLSFPPPAAVATEPAAPAEGTPATVPAQSRQRGSFPVWLVATIVGVLVAGVVAGVLVRRRRRPRPRGAGPVRRRPQSRTSPPPVVEVPAPVEAVMRVGVLGPVTVDGWAEPPQRKKLTELLVYLCLHRDRPRSVARCDPRCGPPGRTVAAGTCWGKRSRATCRCCAAIWARMACCPTGGERATCCRRRWCVTGTASSSRPGRRPADATRSPTDRLVEALGLVRAKPFVGVSARRVRLGVGRAAGQRDGAGDRRRSPPAGQLAVEAGDPRLAGWAALQALAACPEDLRLWEDRLRLAGDDPAEWARVGRDASRDPRRRNARTLAGEGGQAGGPALTRRRATSSPARSTAEGGLGRVDHDQVHAGGAVDDEGGARPEAVDGIDGQAGPALVAEGGRDLLHEAEQRRPVDGRRSGRERRRRRPRRKGAGGWAGRRCRPGRSSR